MYYLSVAPNKMSEKFTLRRCNNLADRFATDIKHYSLDPHSHACAKVNTDVWRALVWCRKHNAWPKLVSKAAFEECMSGRRAVGAEMLG